MQTAAHVAPNKTHQIHTRGRGGVTVPNKTKTTLTKSNMMWCKVKETGTTKGNKADMGCQKRCISVFRSHAQRRRKYARSMESGQHHKQPSKQPNNNDKQKKKRRRRTGRQAGNKSTSQLCRPMNRATSLQADIGVAFQAFEPIKNTQTTPLKPFFSN